VRRASPLLAAVLVVAAGCAFRARKVPDVEYYVLQPAKPTATIARPVQVGAFTADEPYQTARLAYRPGPYELGYYTYHRWAGNAPGVVAAAVRDYLDHAAPDVSPTAGPALVVTGNLRRLEALENPGAPAAALAVEISIYDGRGLIARRVFEEQEPAASKAPEDVAAAASRALGRILDQLLAMLAAAG
jgi:ABC-type uncharacterized transport system auxiliary subunit